MTHALLSLQVADLHDRPERMLAKEVISKVLSWKDARRFFHARINRRVLGTWVDCICVWCAGEGVGCGTILTSGVTTEERVIKRALQASDGTRTRAEVVQLVNEWHGGGDDIAVAQWLEGKAGEVDKLIKGVEDAAKVCAIGSACLRVGPNSTECGLNAAGCADCADGV